MPTPLVKTLQTPDNEIETNSAALVMPADRKAPNDYGVSPISNYEPPTKDLTHAPDSHCLSCGYQLPRTPSSSSSSSSESISPCQPAYIPEVASQSDAFSDLRSPSLARRRDKSAKEKYYGFRYVKRGDLSPERVTEGQCYCCCSQNVEAEEAEHDGEDEQDDDGDNDNDKSDSPSVCTLCTTDKPPSQPTATTETKQDQPPCRHTLYRLAQLPPRPPKNHHRHLDKVQGTLSPRVDERREERKHRKAILKDGLQGL